MKYMDFLEKKLIEIIQLNTDNLKEVLTIIIYRILLYKIMTMKT